MKKWKNELNKNFAKELQMSETYMKECSTSLDILD
jgi:hypothetical protein